MKIGNPTNHSNASAYQKKEKTKLEKKKPSSSSTHNDYLDLSSDMLLLRRLLDSPEHNYTPLPFYFFEAPIKNALTMATIAKSIQQKALQQGVTLNYEMILELTLQHSHDKTQSEISTYPLILLQQEESVFFERFHQECSEQKLTQNTIATVVIEYSQYIQNNNLQISTQKKQIEALLKSINLSNNPTILNQKPALLSSLKNASSAYFSAGVAINSA